MLPAVNNGESFVVSIDSMPLSVTDNFPFISNVLSLLTTSSALSAIVMLFCTINVALSCNCMMPLLARVISLAFTLASIVKSSFVPLTLKCLSTVRFAPSFKRISVALLSKFSLMVSPKSETKVLFSPSATEPFTSPNPPSFPPVARIFTN